MPPKIHVVAGILFNERGEFLLSSRPEGKPYAGYWEFAGGKVEAGETEFAALQREFMEELGVEIIHATPWLAKFYRYEHAHVNLRFFRVAAQTASARATAMGVAKSGRFHRVAHVARQYGVAGTVSHPQRIFRQPENGFAGQQCLGRISRYAAYCCAARDGRNAARSRVDAAGCLAATQ